MMRRLDRVLGKAAGAALLLSGGFCFAQTPAPLPWPQELPQALSPGANPYVSEYVTVLDFHGSVQDPDLVIFMAGNQYRVFPDLLLTFREWVRTRPGQKTVKVDRIFYATTPPGRLIDAMQSGQLVLGNFWIDVQPGKLWPDVFMTGARQQLRLLNARYVEGWSVFARNRGTVLLVRAGNPKHIRGVSDLLRDDVRVAVSSPTLEPDSFESYSNTLRAQGGGQLPDLLLKKPNTISPAVVHHRENPQFIHDGRADVAPMYYHFGDYLKTRLPRDFDYVLLPEEGNFRDALAISTIRNAQHKAAAAAWVDFIRSDAAATVYIRHGFDYVSNEERTRIVREK